jgi:hypothetical protein
MVRSYKTLTWWLDLGGANMRLLPGQTWIVLRRG